MSLYVLQKIALAWMVQKEKSVHCAGGILADDQVIIFVDISFGKLDVSIVINLILIFFLFLYHHRVLVRRYQ